MLKKAWRLTKNEDFERVFRKGTPLFFGAIGCKVLPNDLGSIRLGFSLSKKHVITVANRNRLRRVLVEPFSDYFLDDSHRCSVDVVFFTVRKIEKGHTSPFASVGESVVKYISR